MAKESSKWKYDDNCTIEQNIILLSTFFELPSTITAAIREISIKSYNDGSNDCDASIKKYFNLIPKK